jgi:hypothetical protein
LGNEQSGRLYVTIDVEWAVKTSNKHNCTLILKERDPFTAMSIEQHKKSQIQASWRIFLMQIIFSCIFLFVSFVTTSVVDASCMWGLPLRSPLLDIVIMVFCFMLYFLMMLEWLLNIHAA